MAGAARFGAARNDHHVFLLLWDSADGVMKWPRRAELIAPCGTRWGGSKGRELFADQHENRWAIRSRVSRCSGRPRIASGHVAAGGVWRALWFAHRSPASRGSDLSGAGGGAQGSFGAPPPFPARIPAARVAGGALPRPRPQARWPRGLWAPGNAGSEQCPVCRSRREKKFCAALRRARDASGARDRRARVCPCALAGAHGEPRGGPDGVCCRSRIRRKRRRWHGAASKAHGAPEALASPPRRVPAALARSPGRAPWSPPSTGACRLRTRS